MRGMAESRETGKYEGDTKDSLFDGGCSDKCLQGYRRLQEEEVRTREG